MLFFVYAANFVSVAAKDRKVFGSRENYETVEGAGLAAAPVRNEPEKKAATKVAIHTHLPGAVSSMSKSFDNAPGGEEPVGRVDMNVLPGAIGLGGPFDNNNVAGGATPSGSVPASSNTSVSVASAAPTQSSQSSSTQGGTIVPSSSSIANAVAENSSTASGKNATVDDADVVRDGLGHIIPQKPKKKKKKKKKGSKSSESRGESSEKEEKGKESGKDDKKGSDKESEADDEEKEGAKSSKASDDTSKGGTEGTKSDGDKASKKGAKKTKSESDEGSEAAADSVADSSSTGESESTSSSASPPGDDLSSISMPPVDVGEHPMSRTMTELQVEGGLGKLKPTAVKKAYRKLVKAYLKPFKKGIKRRAFFDILRRKNYSLAPPESNKGIQTILVQIISQSKL